MTLWMVRTGRYGERENFALEKGFVCIGWDEMPDLSTIKSFDEMKELHSKVTPDLSAKVISNFSGQLWAFVGRIQVGDLVALPLKSRSAVAVGKITGDYQYTPEYGEGAKHLRTVEWIRTDIPRTDFAQDFLYSLGAYMTVCQIQRNNAEERIQAMLDGSADPHLKKIVDTKVSVEDGEDETLLNIEEYSQDQIRAYIGSKFKGHELTRLTAALLKAQGYQVYMAPPGPDGGVDIIAGRGAMGFDQPRLCVQVKSGSTPADVTTLRELQGVMKNFGAEQGLFVSWSGFKDTVYKEARTLFFEIRLWDSDKLVTSLLEHYDELSDEIQAELPLKRMWIMVQEPD